jgi:hypothetical protein
MHGQEIGVVAPRRVAHFRDREPTHCPDCEVRFPLQILVAELLHKNQMLRTELQEARSRLTLANLDLLGQQS